jgi:hypothetical protein
VRRRKQHITKLSFHSRGSVKRILSLVVFFSSIFHNFVDGLFTEEEAEREKRFQSFILMAQKRFQEPSFFLLEVR